MPGKGEGGRLRGHAPAGVALFAVLFAVLFFRERRGSEGEPFVPDRDDAVVEHLPSFAEGNRAKELRRLRAALASDPKNLPLAVEVAERAIALYRARSDPRYLGQAEAALLPFWATNDPPPPTLTLRATLRQSQHDFEGALADLDRVLSLTPDDTQAWLTRAVVRTVVARYAEARADCNEVAKRAPRLVAAVCAEPIASIEGDARGAYARLSTTVAEARGARTSADEIAWAESTLGELAIRAGKNDEARAHFRAALEADPGDAYTAGALSDLDLDEGRPADVVARLRGREDNDGLLLRLALAETALASKDAAGRMRALSDRFAASALRGDVVHRREEARFSLALAHEPARALSLAEENWKVQREVADARILLEAALAANEKERAAPVLAWLERTRCEDPTLVALAKACK